MGEALEGSPSTYAEQLDERSEDPYPGYERRRLILAVTLVGFFSTGFLITIVSASLPRIAEDLGASDASATWVLTGAMLAFGIFTPVMGRVSDLWGYRRMYLVGLGASTVSAVLIALSWNIASLVAFRVVWAVAGAASAPASMAIIMRSFRPHERVRAMGWWSFVAAGAPVLGVVAGGPVVEALSWRVVFAGQIPLSLAAIVLALAFLPPDGPGREARLDLAGAVLAGLTVGLLMFGVNRGAEWGWSHPAVLGSLLATPVAGVSFVWAERRAASPLLPVRFLKTRNFAVPLVAHVMASFAYMGGFFITPFLLQRVFGFGVTKTGLFMLPRPLAFTLAAPLAGMLAVRIGERTTIIGAMVAMTASMGFLALGAGDHRGAAILAGLVLSGVALGSAAPSLSSTVANAVPAEYLGTAGAASNLSSTVGAVVGMEALRSVAATAGGTGDAYALAYLGAGVIALLALGPAILIRSYERSLPRAPAAGYAVSGAGRG